MPLGPAERAFDKAVSIKHPWRIELYRDNFCSLEEAHLRYGGSQGLLRCAPQSVADAGRGDNGAGARESGDDEIRASGISNFGRTFLLHLQLVSSPFSLFPLMMRYSITFLGMCCGAICTAQGVTPPMTITDASKHSQVISLTTDQGRAWFADCHENASYFKLSRYFAPQKNLAYCGVASSVMVLNALPVPRPTTAPHAPYAFFTQENFFTPAVSAVRSAEKVASAGMSLTELGAVLAAHEGVKTEVIYADRSTVETFRDRAREQLKTADGFVLINYLRTIVGQEGGGHISPLAAYHEKTDRFLILDVSPYKYPPVWVPTSLLWSSLQALTSGENKRSRGYVIVTATVR